MSTALSSMKKDELRVELEELGAVYSSRDTVEELRALLKDARSKTAAGVKKAPDGTTGLGNLSKTELQAKCNELGITLTNNMTKGQLSLKVKDAIWANQTPVGSDLLSIGKHKDLMYRTIGREYPDYCEWAMDTVAEGDSHPELKRFVKYLRLPESPVMTTRPIPQMPEKFSLKTETGSVASSVSQEVMRKELNELKAQVKHLTESPKKRGASGSTDAMPVDQSNQVNAEMAHVLKAIMQRLENLELAVNPAMSEASWTPLNKEPPQ